MVQIFRLITTVISVYSFLCFLRIIFTWIPSLAYSAVGRFLSSICDPFLNMFRRLPLQFGGLDFSPIVAFGILMIASSICGNLERGRIITFGSLIGQLLYFCWQIAASLLSFLIIFLIIRLVVCLMRKDSYGSIWNQIDYSLNPLVFKISGIFSTGKPISYKNALIIAIITLFIVQLGGKFFINILVSLAYHIPF